MGESVPEILWMRDAVAELVREVDYWKKRYDEVVTIMQQINRRETGKLHHPDYTSENKKRCLHCNRLFRKPKRYKRYQWQRRKFCCGDCRFAYNRGRALAWTPLEGELIRQHYVLKGAKFIHMIIPHKTVDAIRARAKKMGLQTKDWRAVRANKDRFLVHEELTEPEVQIRIAAIREEKIKAHSQKMNPKSAPGRGSTVREAIA